VLSFCFKRVAKPCQRILFAVEECWRAGRGGIQGIPSQRLSSIEKNLSISINRRQKKAALKQLFYIVYAVGKLLTLFHHIIDHGFDIIV
jgi:hypothetical protein